MVDEIDDVIERDMYYPETLYFEPSTGELNASMAYDFCDKWELGERNLKTLQRKIREYYKKYYKEVRGEDCRTIMYTSNMDGIFYMSALDIEHKDAIEKMLSDFDVKRIEVI